MSRSAQRFQSHSPSRAKRSRRDRAAGRRTAPDMVAVSVTVPSDRVGMLRHYAQRLGRRRPSERETVLAALRRHAADLRRRFGVRALALFGSAARDETRQESDIDLLVAFLPGRPTGMFEFVALKHWLEGILSRPVDLVPAETLKGRIRARILREAIPIAVPVLDDDGGQPEDAP